MFGLRSDGKRIKGIDPVQLMASNFMPERIGALNFFTNKVKCEPIDKWIEEQRLHGNSFTYMHVIMASIIRLYNIRPELNRFIMSGRIYQRNTIGMTFVAKSELKDDADEKTIKIEFTGKETIYEVKEIVNKAILENIKSGNSTDDVLKIFKVIPNCVVKAFLWLVRKLDKHGSMPKSLIKASPFHTSFFLTNLKSLKIDACYHHSYNFGTTGLFVAMGKERLVPTVLNDNETIAPVKTMNLGITMDERFCDGFYFAKTLRIWNRILNNLEVLENPPEDDEEIALIGDKVRRVKKEKALKQAEEEVLKESYKQAKKRAKLLMKKG